MSLEQQQLWEWGAGLDNKVPLGAPLEDVGGLEILRAIQRRGAAKDTFLPDVVKKDRRYSSGVFWGHTMHGHGAQKTQHRAAMETMNGVPVKR